VFEFMHHDLAGLMDSPMFGSFREGQLKCYMKQLLEGLFFLHKNNILHRDIKASNLLINNDGVLKLADFGLARPVISETGLQYTNNVITLWYRPPELLLGEEKYGPAVDIWSAGCILAELLLKKPLFPGKTEVDQIALIWDGLGDTLPKWPEVEQLRFWNTLKPPGGAAQCRHPLRDRFAKLPVFERDKFPQSAQAAIKLLEGMLALNPKNRISAQEALDSDWFWCAPDTMKPKDMPRYPSCHEWTAKKRRQNPSQPPTSSNPSGVSSSGVQPRHPPASAPYPTSSRAPVAPVVPRPASGGPAHPGHHSHHGAHHQYPLSQQHQHPQHPHQIPMHHTQPPPPPGHLAHANYHQRPGPSHAEQDMQAPPSKRFKPADGPPEQHQRHMPPQ
jgi:cyclin-dependent kinase 12/13